MPAIDANGQYFLQSTDYPADQTVYEVTGALTIPASSSDQRVTIQHNLPFIPLMGGNWSLVSDFSTSYEFSTGPFPSSVSGQLFDQVVNTFSDATNVYVSADNTNSAAKTIYYRLYGFAPPGDQSSVAPVVNNGDSFILDTDNNLTKLYMFDQVTLPATGGSQVEVDYFHNLGYIPQVQAWIEANGYVFPVPCSHSSASQTLVIAGNIGIGFVIPAGELSHRAWYRIYIDP